MPGFPVQRQPAAARRLAAACALAALLAAATCGLAALLAPAAAADDGLADLPRTLLEQRRQEAEGKQSLAAARLAGGDRTTPNQDDWDVRHYDLDLSLTPGPNVLAGTVTVTAEVTGASIDVFDLDLMDFMVVSAATAGGQPAGFGQGGDLVTVVLDRSYLTGETVVVSVTYAGDPTDGPDDGYFGWDMHEGLPMIWTKSEPYGAPYWWPCKDVNDDKADALDVRVTAPSHLTVASNGLLVSVSDDIFTKTWHWHSDYPICTYLVSLAAYPYLVYSDWYSPLGGGQAMPVTHYVFPDWYEDSQANFAKTVPMLEHFAPHFGEYPFVEEKYGHAHFEWAGGMEHQTLTSIRGWWEDGIAHELAHQWFGDYVTCADFGHIWLNEGFATWSEAMWVEEDRHFEYYQLYMEIASYYGDGTIFVEDPLNENIFEYQLSYNKGSWVVHMLRRVLGDADYYESLRQYLAAHAYGVATTEQFRDVCEAVSGRDLDAFFQQWIYGPGVPDYLYSWQPGAGGGVDLTIEQVQADAGVFAMPIDVRVTRTNGSTQTFVVQNDQATQQFHLPLAGEPAFVQLDPDEWILCWARTALPEPTFDRGVLLVNGVHWGLREEEIRDAYEASAFWGELPISYWDLFEEWPGEPLAANLPPALGHGAVPGDVLAQFSTVIWIADDVFGDLHMWHETPILAYLEAGGNVLCIARDGAGFLTDGLQAFAGVDWAETDAVMASCVAAHPDFVDVPLTGLQNQVDVFWPAVGPNSTLLMVDDAGFDGDRGAGVHAQPPGGGAHRPEGANLVFLAGRAYRMDHDAVRANCEFVLAEIFGEPWGGTPVVPPPAAAALALDAAYPNPFNPRTTLGFSLPAAGEAELAIYDPSGRLVRVLMEGPQPAGRQSLDWDGRDDAGREAASGVYLARLRQAGAAESAPLILLR